MGPARTGAGVVNPGEVVFCLTCTGFLLWRIGSDLRDMVRFPGVSA